MKKLYSLLLLVVTSFSFGQVVFTDNLNYADNSLLTANGWTAHSGAATNSVDVGTSNGLTYTGYSGATGIMGDVVGNAARLDNTGEDVNKALTTPVTSGPVYFSFLVNVTSGDAGYFAHLGNSTNFCSKVYVKPSATTGKINFGIANSNTPSFGAVPTDFDLNTTYLIIVKYDVSATGSLSLWVKAAGVPATEAAAGTPEATASGSGVANVAAVYLRQFVATENITIDGLRVSTAWFGATACALSLAAETTLCNASTPGTDTYNVSIPFTGGGTGTYNLVATSGTIGGDNPSTTAAGTITISNVSEGTGVTLTVSGSCDLSKVVISPECKPINALPYGEPFDYAVGSALKSSYKWTSVNTGDDIVTVAGNLTYAGISSTGNSISFSGLGAECFTPYTSTTSGTIYTSFLVNVSDIANVTTDLASTYFAGMTDSAKGYQGRLFVRKNAAQYQLGFDSASTTTNWDATLRNTGDVVYVVMGYDFATNTLKCWLNPTVATFTDATTPTFTNNPTLTAPLTSYANMGGFILRQDGANTTPTIIVDELRVATTIADLLSVKNNAISGLSVYPNPVKNGVFYINSDANAVRTVTVFDVVGKQVLNTTTSNGTVNVSSLNAGIYMVKITEEGKTATKKLVIE